MNGPGSMTADGSNPNQLVAGVDMQNIWLNYNASTDTMYVGIQGFTNVAGQEEIFGDISGNLNPALDATPPRPDRQCDQHVPGAQVGRPRLRAGRPQRRRASPSRAPRRSSPASRRTSRRPAPARSTASPSRSTAPTAGLPFSFGQQIANAGNLAFNRRRRTPDFEFTINNFSKISGINPANGFYIQGYAGMPGETRTGRSQSSWIYPPGTPELQRPEPTTWLAWLLLAGGAGWRYRRRLAARAVIWVAAIGSAW